IRDEGRTGEGRLPQLPLAGGHKGPMLGVPCAVGARFGAAAAGSAGGRAQGPPLQATLVMAAAFGAAAASAGGRAQGPPLRKWWPPPCSLLLAPCFLLLARPSFPTIDARRKQRC